MRWTIRQKEADPEGWRERRRQATQRWREKNREKVNAHASLANALKVGKIERPDHCEQCGKECKPEGHHPDYSKRLDVVWLCRQCHAPTCDWESRSAARAAA
jgi:hypothetical protein